MTRATENQTHDTPAQTEALVQAFIRSDPKTGQLEEQARRLLSREHFIRNIGKIPPEDLVKLIAKFNQVYEIVDARDRNFLVPFGRFCSVTQQLPPSVLLSAERVKCDSVLAVASGGLTNVWRGNHQGILVAIKAFRAYPTRNLEETKQILWGLAPALMKLTHRNIAKFRGVTTDLFQVALIYDWGENGTIMEYISLYPDAPRLTLLLHVARGLEYLHSLDIPHGNIKQSNVVVNEFGQALLTDYGLAVVNTNSKLTVASSTIRNSRRLGPEIIDPPIHSTGVAVESKPADVFAFGMLAIEVFTGNPPFEGCSDIGAAGRILDGVRPERPQNANDIGLTPGIWELLGRCWDQDPARRPTIEEVVMTCEGLLGIHNSARRTSNDRNRVESAPDADDLPSEPQLPPPRLNTGSVKRWWRKLLCAWG